MWELKRKSLGFENNSLTKQESSWIIHRFICLLNQKSLDIKDPVLFIRSVVSNSLWPHGLQHARLPCPSPSLGACSNSCPLSQWCHLVSLSSPFPPAFDLSQHQGLFRWSALHIRWPKYGSISPSNEYSGLISSRIDWFDLFAVQGSLKSLLQHHSSKASILWHSKIS